MFANINIDKLNIFLMLLSAVIAFFIPFELFLFVYAFLGPLHYLTEINWLHQKGYYTTSKNDYKLFLFLIFLIGISVFSPLSKYLRVFLPVFIAFGFLSAFAMQYFEKQKSKLIFYAISFLISFGLFCLFKQKSEIVFSIFLPSLIHVFIFTGLFILVGAIKNKNKIGKIALFVFFICGIGLLFIPYFPIKNNITETITTAYHSFERINQTLINYFSENTNTVFSSNIGFQIMRFIAFAYTYHYLNWFSKTSIIQWHKSNKLNLSVIVLIWVLSVGLYSYNYTIGLKWLYLLSLTHVLLEFPLNFLSIRILLTKVKTI